MVALVWEQENIRSHLTALTFLCCDRYNERIMNWLTPWIPVLEHDLAERLITELRREIEVGHVLFGIPVRPIATRQDCDDVLFELLDGSGRLAVTHMTYAQHPEPNPQWPVTRLYDDLSQFENVMQVDHSNAAGS